jgi:hypothetical protein
MTVEGGHGMMDQPGGGEKDSGDCVWNLQEAGRAAQH